MSTALDKFRFAEFLASHDVATPFTILLDSTSPVDAISWPALAKPILGHAGKGIIRVNGREELDQLIQSGQLPVNKTYLLQSFIHGYDIDCSFIAIDGRMVVHTIQRGLGGGKRDFAASEAVEFVRSTRIASFVERLVEALDWNGVGHVDLRVDAETSDIYAIELNPRFWATIHGSYKAGINFPLILVLDALGKTPTPADYSESPYMAINAWVRKLGVVRAGRRMRWIRPDQTSLGLVLRDPVPHLRSIRRHIPWPRSSDA